MHHFLMLKQRSGFIQFFPLLLLAAFAVTTLVIANRVQTQQQEIRSRAAGCYCTDSVHYYCPGDQTYYSPSRCGGSGGGSGTAQGQPSGGTKSGGAPATPQEPPKAPPGSVCTEGIFQLAGCCDDGLMGEWYRNKDCSYKKLCQRQWTTCKKPSAGTPTTPVPAVPEATTCTGAAPRCASGFHRVCRTSNWYCDPDSSPSTPGVDQSSPAQQTSTPPPVAADLCGKAGGTCRASCSEDQGYFKINQPCPYGAVCCSSSGPGGAASVTGTAPSGGGCPYSCLAKSECDAGKGIVRPGSCSVVGQVCCNLSAAVTVYAPTTPAAPIAPTAAAPTPTLAPPVKEFASCALGCGADLNCLWNTCFNRPAPTPPPMLLWFDGANCYTSQVKRNPSDTGPFDVPNDCKLLEANTLAQAQHAQQQTAAPSTPTIAPRLTAEEKFGGPTTTVAPKPAFSCYEECLAVNGSPSECKGFDSCVTNTPAPKLGTTAPVVAILPGCTYEGQCHAYYQQVCHYVPELGRYVAAGTCPSFGVTTTPSVVAPKPTISPTNALCRACTGVAGFPGTICNFICGTATSATNSTEKPYHAPETSCTNQKIGGVTYDNTSSKPYKKPFDCINNRKNDTGRIIPCSIFGQTVSINENFCESFKQCVIPKIEKYRQKNESGVLAKIVPGKPVPVYDFPSGTTTIHIDQGCILRPNLGADGKPASYSKHLVANGCTAVDINVTQNRGNIPLGVPIDNPIESQAPELVKAAEECNIVWGGRYDGAEGIRKVSKTTGQLAGACDPMEFAYAPTCFDSNSK